MSLVAFEGVGDGLVERQRRPSTQAWAKAGSPSLRRAGLRAVVDGAIGQVGQYNRTSSNPCPTFHPDMPAEERAVMDVHIAYWSAKAEQGIAIVFGR